MNKGFDIRKATGRNKEVKNGHLSELGTTVVLPQNIQSVNIDLAKNKLEGPFYLQLNLFDNIVSRKYLTQLSRCPIMELFSNSESKMGWYKVTKIVLDKESFFPNQLSMLYTALHNVAKNVALVIDKKGNDDVELYLGARDFSGNLHTASTLLKTSIQGYLPGVKIDSITDDESKLKDKLSSMQYVASYSGTASLRDDKKTNFMQGIEKFIDATSSIPSFTALFIADNVSQEQALNMIQAFSSIEDAFSPLMQCQETFSENETKGVSTTITDTISETLTESLSETITNTKGTNTSYSSSYGTINNVGSNEQPNILKSVLNTIIGGPVGTNKSDGQSTQNGKADGKHEDIAKANQKTESKAKTESNSTAKNNSLSETRGISRQITKTNTQIKHYVEILERHIEQLHNGMPFGLWSIGTYFVSPDESTSLKLANIYRGCVTGENSDSCTSAVNVWGKENSRCLLDYLKDTQNPRFLVGNINVSAGVVVTSKELAIHMSLPQSSIPGVEVRECATFGRNLNKNVFSIGNDKNELSIGFITHLSNQSHKKVSLNIEELSKHVFVTGSTGSGKSNAVYLLVNGLLNKGKKILIVEPTKGDYRKVFGGRKDFTVYGTRPDEKNLLRINPFAFPDSIRVEEHVERLVEIFGVCWPMYAAMPAVLKDSILSAYEACGWNIKKSVSRHGRLFPTIADVIIQLKRIISTSDYSADTKGDYIGSLQTRLQSLTNGVYSYILSSSKTIDYVDLYDKNAIIDLHRIGSAETRALLMGLLVLGLTEWRMSQGEDSMDQSLQHVTVLEEAHCILPRVSKEQNQEGANVVGKSVEMIASAIAEMRTYGEGFIIVDQSPSMVDEAAIRNTNTKIVMNLPDGDDRNIAGKSIGLIKDVQFAELARLNTGEAVVWQRGWGEAVMAVIDEMKDKYPLLRKDNLIEYKDEDINIPSDLFIKYFIEQIQLSEIESKELIGEIYSSDCKSGIKALLLDVVANKLNSNDSILRDSILEYLGLDQVVKSIFEQYDRGCSEILWRLRDDMANRLNIVDTTIQNRLLSMAFEMASLQNSRWYDLCSQSMPHLVNN